MSILAERKRKQKFSLNPRGKAWSEDSNKFGQKMLEKMGWSRGKGLGAREDGITEHIRISYKNDSKGMGYKETEEWTQHEANFASLLESLSNNTTTETEIKVSSLEEKSKKSKARVHYQKFMRGKDLSRYSEKDLANIFGKKTLKAPPDEKSEAAEEMDETSERAFGVETTNGGSMADYFKMKTKKFKPETNSESESESKARTFGFGFQKSANEQVKPKKRKQCDEEIAHEEYEIKIKKRKKEKDTVSDAHDEGTIKKKKKKKKAKSDV